MRSPSKSERGGSDSDRIRRMRTPYPSRSRSVRCQTCSRRENPPPSGTCRVCEASSVAAAFATSTGVDSSVSSSVSRLRRFMAPSPELNYAPGWERFLQKERKWRQRKGIRSEVSCWHNPHFSAPRLVILRSAALPDCHSEERSDEESAPG